MYSLGTFRRKSGSRCEGGSTGAEGVRAKKTYGDQSPFPPAVPDRLKTKERRETTVDMLCYHEKREKMCFMMVPT